MDFRFPQSFYDMFYALRVDMGSSCPQFSLGFAFKFVGFLIFLEWRPNVIDGADLLSPEMRQKPILGELCWKSWQEAML